MGITVDYYLTPKSPWTYLGHRRFEEILKRHDAAVNVKAVDIRRVFAGSGGLPLGQRASQRQAYNRVELERVSEHLGIRFNVEPKFFPGPGDEVPKLVIAADAFDGADAAMRLAYALMRACWAENRNLEDPAEREAVMREQGLDPVRLNEFAGSEKASVSYEQNSDEALARGVFGAPSYVVDDEIFWGQDRLEYLDRRLGG